MTRLTIAEQLRRSHRLTWWTVAWLIACVGLTWWNLYRSAFVFAAISGACVVANGWSWHVQITTRKTLRELQHPLTLPGD